MCRCESGDLTGKHGQLDISPDGSDRPTYTYVDSNVQLTGDFTSEYEPHTSARSATSSYNSLAVIGRSIAIHDIIEDLPIFDCGTVERVYISSEVATIVTDPSNELRYVCV